MARKAAQAYERWVGRGAGYTAPVIQRVEVPVIQRVEVRVPSPDTPDPTAFEIENVEEVGGSLIMSVRYPTCQACSYEGVKILVYLGRTLKDAIRWKKIDPHFAGPEEETARGFSEAPSPSARFPASKAGWADAVEYATRKSNS